MSPNYHVLTRTVKSTLGNILHGTDLLSDLMQNYDMWHKDAITVIKLWHTVEQSKYVQLNCSNTTKYISPSLNKQRVAIQIMQSRNTTQYKTGVMSQVVAYSLSMKWWPTPFSLVLKSFHNWAVCNRLRHVRTKCCDDKCVRKFAWPNMQCSVNFQLQKTSQWWQVCVRQMLTALRGCGVNIKPIHWTFSSLVVSHINISRCQHHLTLWLIGLLVVQWTQRNHWVVDHSWDTH